MEQSGVWNKVKHAWSFVEKHALLFALLGVLVLQFVPNGDGTYPWGGIWMRMQVKDFHTADSAAASAVENFLNQQVSAQVQQNYPNLPEGNRQKVIDDLKVKFREENKDQLEIESKKLAEEIRNHYMYESDGEKFLYMPDIDPYYYLRFARNIIETGHSYDVLKDGVPWDNHMIAPIGTSADKSWHGPLLALIYRIHSSFADTTLMNSACYFPIILIFLSLIFVFLIAYRVSGPVGGIFATTMLAILPAVMGRTPWGHADTDAYNIFFPCLIVWLLFEALSSKSSKKQLIFGGLSGLAFGLYASFWGNWWYLFDFIGGAIVIAILADVVMHRSLLKEGFKRFWHHSSTKKFVFVGASLFVVAAIFCSFTIGFSQFYFGTFKAAIGYTSLKEAAASSLWPNTLTTVAELNPGSIDAVINAVGGRLIFLIGILGIILLLIKKDDNKFDFTYSALLAIWFVGTMYMSIKGVRFILLIGPAFAVAFGAGAGLLYRMLSNYGEKSLKINRIITGVLVIVVLALVIMNPAKAGSHMVKESYNSAISDVPLVNDAWWNALTKIKDNSQPDAIINSWWDFGHHFKYIADRAVSFDGASQTLPHAHWVGRVLQTDDEEEAVAILRMLDCGSYTAHDVALETIKDPLLSVEFVKKLIMMDKESAREAVKEAGVSERILDLTHCDAPEDFFIASGDMIGKAGVWSHFGLWNFERAEVWLKWKNLPESEAVPQMAERFNISEDDAKSLYNAAGSLGSEESANAWISPWPSYAIQEPAGCSVSGDALNCGNIVINMSSQQAQMKVNKGVAPIGKIVLYDKKGEKKVFSPGGSDLAVVLWPTASGTSAIAANAELADSIFTRLFFMNGLGLKHFKSFDTQRQLFGGMIYVYKIDWLGGEPYVPADLMPKESVESGARVSLNYIGWSEDGVFDSSIVDWRENNVSQYAGFESFETNPLSVIVGQGALIPGFEKQIMGMKAGDTKTIKVPPEEAYGTDPEKHPLGNKTLNFKVKVVSVE